MPLQHAKRLVGPPLRRAQQAALRRIFEPGLEDTETTVPAHDIGLERADDRQYQPSTYLQPYRAMRGVRVGPDDVFVDYGSGKGRVVLQVARRWRMRRVIGVELGEALNEVARRNLGRMRPKLRTQDVELVTADVMAWQVPDDVTFAYHFNSVGGEVLDGLLARLVESLDRRPRTIRFMYANPLHHDQVVATGRFRLLSTSKGLRRDLPGFWINVYEGR